MEIVLKNTELVFQKAVVIEQSYTKTFTQSDIGHGASVTMQLSKPVKPNMKLIVSISGDAGVVNNNDLWAVKPNGSTSYSKTCRRGESVEFLFNGEIGIIELQRDAPNPIAAGSVIVTARYFDDTSYEPEVKEGELTISAGSGSETLSFDEPILGPGFVKVKASVDSGTLANRLKVSFLNTQGETIGNQNIDANGSWVYCGFGETSVASVKFEAVSGATYTDIFSISICH